MAGKFEICFCVSSIICGHYITKSNSRITMRPTNELVNSRAPQVLKVSLIEMPNDCWNSRYQRDSAFQNVVNAS